MDLLGLLLFCGEHFKVFKHQTLWESHTLARIEIIRFIQRDTHISWVLSLTYDEASLSFEN